MSGFSIHFVLSVFPRNWLYMALHGAPNLLNTIKGHLLQIGKTRPLAGIACSICSVAYTTIATQLLQFGVNSCIQTRRYLVSQKNLILS